jgi:hypothetical protein
MMAETVSVSLFCPKMKINRIGFRHYRTAIEDMELTLVFSDGRIVEKFIVEIKETDVHVRLASLPTIAMVDACRGSGQDGNGNLFVTDLPQEPVNVEVIGGGIMLVAKQIVAPSRLMLADMSEWEGNVTFGDCPVSGGSATALTALGILTRTK